MVCKQCQTNQLGGQSLAQPPSPPIRGTQGPPPNRAKRFQKKVPWHLTEFPSFTKNSISVAVHIFPIHQYQLFKFYMDFMVCNMHFWEEILKVLHPSSSNTPKEIPGGETPTFAIKLRLRILWTLRKGLLGPGSRTCGVDSKDFPMETQDPNEKKKCLTNSMCKDLVVFLFPKGFGS